MEVGTALFLIFCTPLGWIGMFMLAVAICVVRS